MFSLRTIVLLGAAVYMLPTDPARQQKFIDAASGAFERITTTCERDPELCKKAAAIYEDLKSKAHFGAGVIYALATGKAARGNAPEPDPAGTQRWDGTPKRTPSQGTLNPADMAPAWRGAPSAASSTIRQFDNR